MTITNCPKCGSFNITTAGVCENCGWSPFAQVALCTRITGEMELKVSGKALLDDYKRLLFENNKLTSRIAKLEGLVDELKPYRDGYDPEEVFPPEGEWVWLRDCDDNVEVMGYSQKEKCYWNYDGTRMPDDGDIVRWYPIGKLPEVQE